MSAFPAIRNHVLLPWANRIPETDRELRKRVSGDLFTEVLGQIPDAWLLQEPGTDTSDEKRRGYVEYLSRRLDAASSFVEEAQRAHDAIV